MIFTFCDWRTLHYNAFVFRWHIWMAYRSLSQKRSSVLANEQRYGLVPEWQDGTREKNDINFWLYSMRYGRRLHAKRDRNMATFYVMMKRWIVFWRHSNTIEAANWNLLCQSDSIIWSKTPCVAWNILLGHYIYKEVTGVRKFFNYG